MTVDTNIYIYECSTRYVISSKGDRCSIKKNREKEKDAFQACS